MHAIESVVSSVHLAIKYARSNCHVASINALRFVTMEAATLAMTNKKSSVDAALQRFLLYVVEGRRTDRRSVKSPASCRPNVITSLCLTNATLAIVQIVFSYVKSRCLVHIHAKRSVTTT